MNSLLAFLVVAAGLAAVMAGFAWFASRVRRRGIGGALMGPIDEIYHPAAHRYRFEIQIQAERQVPMPSPGDKFGRDAPE